MRKVLVAIYRLLVSFGLDPIKLLIGIKGVPGYVFDFAKLKRQQNKSTGVFPFVLPYPCLQDRFTESGSAKGHYFHQDLLVARRIYSNDPIIHVDVGSRVDGFVAHVASFRVIKVIDIRPLSLNIKNIEFMQANMMTPVPSELTEYCDSISSLHAIEHFGLGRYGDPVDYDGHLRGLSSLYSLLKRGGKLYFSVPIGPQRIEFNAHRVFSLRYLVDLFSINYRIDYFSYVDDRGDLYENVPLIDVVVNDNYGCFYGLGIFEMTKL